MGDAVVVEPLERMRRAADDAPAVRLIADALIDGHAIHWDGADALGRTPRERTLARELRHLAWLSTHAGEPPAPEATPPPGALSRLERILTAAAAVQVVLAAGVLMVAGAPAASSVARAAAMASCASAAVALLVRGRLDARARSVGHALFLLAALQARPLLDMLSALSAPPWWRVASQALCVEAFLPFAVWQVARACPGVVRFSRFDGASRALLAVALAWSVLLAIATARAALGPAPESALGRSLVHWQAAGAPFWTVLLVWTGAAVLTVAVRSRARTDQDIQSRWMVTAVATGLLPLAWTVPATVAAAGASLWPWFVAMPWLWRETPGCPRPSLACPRANPAGVLRLLIFAALILPALAVFAGRGESLDALLAEVAVVSSLVVGGCASILLAFVRWRDAREMSRRRERGQHGSGLALVAADVARGRTPREIAAMLRAHTADALDTDVAAVLAPSGPTWIPMAGTTRAVPGDSAVAALLATPGPPLRVGAADRLFGLLPRTDRMWLRDAGVEVVAPVAGPDGQALAALLLGGRRDGRPHAPRDLAFVAAAASTAAMALQAEAGRQVRWCAADQTSDDSELGFECVACGSVATAADGCDCGGARVLSSLPPRVAGKFVVERRIGRGGMGVVYLATDERLGRQVALKTLPRLLPGSAAGMYAEARAMAAVAHPSVAVLYELHVWRDTPVLVAEYLPAGTLAARLGAGPMPTADAVTLALSLADTLADLHDGGWVHGDVKPSNVGLARGGAPKLLDFGLTRLVARAGPQAPATGSRDAPGPDSSVPLAGTPLYLPPEALEGRSVGGHADLWALSVVLFEMVAGVHPFRASSVRGMLRGMRRAGPVDVHDLAPQIPAPLAQLLRHALQPNPSQRIATAAEFGTALRVVSSQI